MVYNYLLDLYRMLDERKKELEEEGQSLPGSTESNEYRQGQLTAVDEFTTFLKDNYHDKLPRRMR